MRAAAAALLAAFSLLAAGPGLSTEEEAGQRLFAAHCAACHEGGVARAPNRALLELLTPEAIYAAITTGPMQVQAQGLDENQRTALAQFLAARPLGTSTTVAVHRCTADAGWFDWKQPPSALGWGIDRENRRFIPARVAKLTREQVPDLELAWAFAYPGLIRAAAEPLVAGGAVFVGSQDGDLYALDARTGCVRWVYHGGGEIRGAPVMAPWSAVFRARRSKQTSPGPGAPTPTVYFGDNFGVVHAVDAETGMARWRRRVDDHSAARVYGTPVLLGRQGGERLYVPVASFEEVAASTATYPCCTFRGSVVALDATSGRQLWKRYTIPDAAFEQGRNSAGAPRYGPSGAGVWSSPTVDARRGLLYFATGNNYSGPADAHSNAVFAIDLDTGALRWSHQLLAGDASNMSCYAPLPGSRFSLGNDVNCPAAFGPDLDLTGPPLLINDAAGRDILVTGAKSGTIYGLDPDHRGRVLWTTRLSRGTPTAAGGFFFGLAAEGTRVFVPLLDFPMSYYPQGDSASLAGTISRDGLYALDAFSGRLLWSAPAQAYCTPPRCGGNPAAAIAIPGVVFAGSVDGMLRAFDSHTGRMLWEHDTTVSVITVSGEQAHGGTISGSGILVAGGTVFVNSGYGGITGSPGNVLLAFRARRH